MLNPELTRSSMVKEWLGEELFFTCIGFIAVKKAIVISAKYNKYSYAKNLLEGANIIFFFANYEAARPGEYDFI
jgi:hypothetical protein